MNDVMNNSMATANTISTTAYNWVSSSTTSTGTIPTSTFYTGTPHFITKPKMVLYEDELYVGTNEGEMTLKEYITGKEDKYKIKDINVYGKPDPRVVEVIFDCGESDKKIRAICDKDDVFDFEYGIYIAIAKFLYGKELTVKGIDEKAHELSLYKENDKIVKKAIRNYHKKLNAEEEAKVKEAEEKAAKLNRKEKNKNRKQRRKEKSQNELKRLIREAILD